MPEQSAEFIVVGLTDDRRTLYVRQQDEITVIGELNIPIDRAYGVMQMMLRFLDKARH